MRDEDIDFSDNPEWTPEGFGKAVVHIGFKPLPPKEQITLRIDADVLEWFRALGRISDADQRAIARLHD